MSGHISTLTQSVDLHGAATDADGRLLLAADEVQALLRECFARYRAQLIEFMRSSLDQTNDLFETYAAIPNGEVEAFRSKRGEWLERCDGTLKELFERRLAGHRRRGRRLDSDASAASLKVLTAFDHDKQAALTAATQFLARFTRRELDALDLRVDVLLHDAESRDIDNPFGIQYILDAMGSTSRAVYSNPRIWRPLLERLLADLTPAFNKLYISLNRFLADRGVLPEIKAALRARSALRPVDDRELFNTFSHMLHDADQALPTDIVVPETLSDPGAPPALVFADRPSVAAGASGSASLLSIPGLTSDLMARIAPALMSTPAILAGLMKLGGASAGAGGSASRETPANPNDFPGLDPLMALGTSSPLFATLAQWQRIDLPAALAKLAGATAGGDAAVAVPRNLIPHMRAAVVDQIVNPTDRITLDVIALLFDYIFRDPSISESQRTIFGRLQVPIVKAALLDRSFFSDRKHPARQLLDHLAEAAIGAVNDEAYGMGLELHATGVVDAVCRDFEIDVAVFKSADEKLLAFIDAERIKSAAALKEDVALALAAEEGEPHRAHVRAQIRDKLAGLDIPFDVRSFAETLWADYVTALAQRGERDEVEGAMKTLDDMLWSIVAKERTAQKARLTKMIPTLIGGLRKGCMALRIPDERTTAFFESLYQMHIAAIKPKSETTTAPSTTSPARARTSAEDAGPANDAVAERTVEPQTAPLPNVHDYVSEMVVGTWLSFNRLDEPILARLAWISPLRSKYIFTSRARSRAFVYTPEELAYELDSGQVSLVVEPVPLFDRAVSAALDKLAAKEGNAKKLPPLAA